MFDQAGRLTALTHARNAATLADYDWTYDRANRVTQFVSLADGTVNYSYDQRAQLTGADYSYQADETYTYDDNGNRTNTGYSTGANNRLLSDGAYNYEYDAEGNRTKRTNIATGEYVVYEWDYRNRLTAVRFKTSTGTLTKQVEYDYDLFDRRIGKRVDANGDSVYESAFRFVFDGQDIVLVFNGAGSLEQRYLHGPAVDQVLASEDALGDVLWSLPDNQGTVRDIAAYDAATDTTTVENHRKFDAFGNITAESAPSVDFLYAYTGREWDADAELYYYRARWYDPLVGRFLSEDPIYDDYSNPSRYVGNSPTNATDPSGLFDNWGPDYYYYLAGEDSWLTGMGRALKGIGSGLNPTTIPDDVQRMWNSDTYIEDVQRFQEMREDFSGYVQQRYTVVCDGVTEHFSTPAGWGEAYVYVGTFLVAKKFQANRAAAARNAAAAEGTVAAEASASTAPLRLPKKVPSAAETAWREAYRAERMSRNGRLLSAPQTSAATEAHNAANFARYKLELTRLADDTIVVHRPVAGATAAQEAQIREYVSIANLAECEGYMSPTGRVSTTGRLRAAANRAAAAERTRAANAGMPYRGVVGHGPDTTWTGRPDAPFWLDMDSSINSSIGRQALDYPLGFCPGRFIFEDDF